jgi:hypothetical protein
VNFNGGRMNVTNATVATGSAMVVGDGTHSATLNLTGGTAGFADGLVLSTSGYLTGIGTITGNVSNYGDISPGHSPGEVDVLGDLKLESSSIMDMQLGGTTQGTGFDFMHITGTTTLAGDLDLSFVNGFLSSVTHDETFTILNSGTLLQGEFANVASGGLLTTTDGLASFMVTYSDGHDVVISDFTAVPEPGTLGLLTVGMVGWIARRRRWRC